MDTVFYDQDGEAIAYSEDGIYIYFYSGIPIAYIEGDSIYAFSGEHLGWYEAGWVLDHDGNAVFFTENAQGLPLKLLRNLRPLKEFKVFMPMKELRESRPARPLKTLNWSQLTIGDIFLI